MTDLTDQQLLNAIHRGMQEVHRRFAKAKRTKRAAAARRPARQSVARAPSRPAEKQKSGRR